MRLRAPLLIISSVMALTLCACSGSTFSKNEHVGEAVARIEERSYEEAQVLLDEADEAGEDAQLIARARGILSMAMGEYEEAETYLESAIALADGHVTELEFDISFYLLSAQKKAGHPDEAIETCSAILGLRPQDADTYFLRGTLNIENDMYDDALRDFNRAVDNAGSGIDMYIKVYEYLDQRGYTEAAADYLDRAASLDGRFSDYQKGKLAYCRGDLESARDYLEKARMSEEEGVILYLGRTYEALGDYNFAASLYNTYAEKHPEDAEIFNQLGLCRLSLDDYDEALAAFKKGLDTGNEALRSALEFNTITAYERKGDHEKAKSLIKDYIREYPTDEAAKREEAFLTQWDRYGE